MRYRHLILVLAAAGAALAFRPAKNPDAGRWEREAQEVTITRDDWGIAHVHAKTDAGAVFGMEYAQAEDDFNRVETNYINGMGRLAEAEGEPAIWRDLRMKMFVDPAELKKEYGASPAWLRNLMDAFADGLNYYLYKHPEVTPRVIAHFEPWMALGFTEGSIGTDIEQIKLGPIQEFYGKVRQAAAPAAAYPPEPGGSNGIAVGPSSTTAHHALLLINPHTSFFFRSELQMSSDEGLNAYGAVTWGQFFVYQGFNDRIGWMHTTSWADQMDYYLETVSKRDGRYFYKYGSEERPVIASRITIPYKTASGMEQRTFTVYRTQHGPVVGESNGEWMTVSLMQEPVKALTESYTRTKARDYKSFLATVEMQTNSSNNTVYADADGDIAYFQATFIPRRDPHFDWTKPVDGSNPATEWHGLLSMKEIPHIFNPASGWIYNSNDAPWTAAGPSSPKREDYPPYVEKGGENPRSLHAIRLLSNKKDFTLDSLVTAAFDSYLPWFAKPIPALVRAWDGLPGSNPLKAQTAEQIAVLRKWDFRWAADSVPTSLAIFWGEEVRQHAGHHGPGVMESDLVAALPPEQLVQALAAASARLQSDFGSWRTPWGEINRFQRLTGDIVQHFSDAAPSIPVPFTSSNWGSLAAFGARPYPGTKKWYGTSGNSFVAVVEFGDKVRARAVTTGGESGHPQSPHFDDEAQRYASGNLREVYFYPEQLREHTERRYHPGE